MKREILDKTKITTDGIQHAFCVFNFKKSICHALFYVCFMLHITAMTIPGWDFLS